MTKMAGENPGIEELKMENERMKACFESLNRLYKEKFEAIQLSDEAKLALSEREEREQFISDLKHEIMDLQSKLEDIEEEKKGLIEKFSLKHTDLEESFAPELSERLNGVEYILHGLAANLGTLQSKFSEQHFMLKNMSHRLEDSQRIVVCTQATIAAAFEAVHAQRRPASCPPPEDEAKARLRARLDAAQRELAVMRSRGGGVDPPRRPGGGIRRLRSMLLPHPRRGKGDVETAEVRALLTTARGMLTDRALNDAAPEDPDGLADPLPLPGAPSFV